MSGVPTVWVGNKALVAYFIEHGVKPLDVELSYDGHRSLLFLFNTYKTGPLYSEWLQTHPSDQ